MYTMLLSGVVLATAATATSIPDVPNFGPDFVASVAENMNGEYMFSSTPGGTPGKFPKNYRDYPGGVEYYDVISPPITTYYSQVWWSPLAPVPLPAAFVEKYRNKTIAIVGWEIDQIRVTPDGKEVSVPITASYNHHYNAVLIGAASRFEKVLLSGPNDPRAADLLKHSHGSIPFDQPHYVVVENENEKSKGPSTAYVTSGNGGEYRKTYHGYAPGYAVLLESPTALQISPMQIDTWNRDKMNISGPLPPKFVPGPLPRASEAPSNPQYSGLLECPMTTRLTKVIEGDYVLESSHQVGCASGQSILTFQECFHAAAATMRTGGQSFHNATGPDASRPSGCSATTDPADPLSVNVFFNTIKTSTIPCGGASSPGTVLAGASAPDSLGVQVAVLLNASNSLATLTLSGPTGVWFGIGFGAQVMGDRPWTVIVDGSGAVSERKLGGPPSDSHVEGDPLSPSVKVVNTSVSGVTRTVVLSRPLEGAGPDYYTFIATPADPTVPFISAVGKSPTLSHHKNQMPSKLTLLPVGPSVPGDCVCPETPAAFGQAKGSLVYHRVENQTVDTGTGAVAFGGNKCMPFPTTVLLEQNNPTCDIRSYTGGQSACHHMWSLLDADQEIPWSDQPLVFHHKWRLWVQPYDESYHTPVTYGFDADLLIGSPYEYDVPACNSGNNDDAVPAGCTFDKETSSWIHTITGNRIGKHHFAGLNFHCHAPTCTYMAVYACDRDIPLQDCNATVGKLICEQRPVYGGTDAPQLNGTRFDEAGYVAIPDCFWGSAEFGLEAPLNLTGVPLHMIKKANATWPHYGEMAGGQPWVY